MYTISPRANSEKPQPSRDAPALNERQAKYAPARNRTRWTSRNPTGGMLLTKSPKGMALGLLLPG